MSTKPIATAPTDDEERILHLWCPELGSWEAGVFFESDWRAHVNLDLVLKPSHWREPPPPPADSPDERSDLACGANGGLEEPKG